MTIALDEELVERARALAQREGTTFNEMIRRYLELVAGRSSGKAAAEDLRRLWKASSGHSGGRKIGREEAYEERLSRKKR